MTWQPNAVESPYPWCRPPYTGKTFLRCSPRVVDFWFFVSNVPVIASLVNERIDARCELSVNSREVTSHNAFPMDNHLLSGQCTQRATSHSDREHKIQAFTFDPFEKHSGHCNTLRKADSSTCTAASAPHEQFTSIWSCQGTPKHTENDVCSLHAA